MKAIVWIVILFIVIPIIAGIGLLVLHVADKAFACFIVAVWAMAIIREIQRPVSNKE